MHALTVHVPSTIILIEDDYSREEMRTVVIHCTCVTWSGTFQFSCTKNLKFFEFKNFSFSMWSLGKIMCPFFKQLKI